MSCMISPLLVLAVLSEGGGGIGSETVSGDVGDGLEREASTFTYLLVVCSNNCLLVKQ